MDQPANPSAGPLHQRFADATAARRRWVVAGLLLLLACGFTGAWKIGPDTSLHAAIARSIADGRGFHHPVNDHLKVQPGLSYFLAATLSVGDGQSLVPAHVVMFIIGLATLALVYLLMRKATDPGVAVIVTLMVGCCENFYRYCYQLLADLPFLAFVLLMLIGLECLGKRWRSPMGWSLVAVGLAGGYVFRSVILIVIGGLMLAGLIALARVNLKRFAIGAAVTLALLVVAGFIAAPHLAGSQSDLAIALNRLTNPGETLKTMFAVNLGELLGEVTPEAVFAIDFGPIVGSVLSIAVLITMLGLFRMRVIWGGIIVAMLSQWLIFWPSDRYYLVILPLVALGWYRAAVWLNTRLKHPYSDWAFAALLVLWFAPNLIKCVDFAINQHTAEPKVWVFDDAADHPNPVYRLATRAAHQVDRHAVILSEAGNYQVMTALANSAMIQPSMIDQVGPTEGRPFYQVVPTDQAGHPVIVEGDIALIRLTDEQVRSIRATPQ